MTTGTNKGKKNVHFNYTRIIICTYRSGLSFRWQPNTGLHILFLVTQLLGEILALTLKKYFHSYNKASAIQISNQPFTNKKVKYSLPLEFPSINNKNDLKLVILVIMALWITKMNI